MNKTKDLINLAKKLYEKKNFFEAKSNLLTALKEEDLDNDYKLRLYVLLSDICEKINEFDDAEKYLLKYVEQGKKNLKIFFSLANIYLKKRDFKKSEIFFLKALNIDKNNEASLIGISLLYENFGKQEEAKKFYHKILKINPKNLAVMFNLSKIDKNFINDNLLNFVSKTLKEKKLNDFNKASGYFLLAENERNKKNFGDEINYLKIGHKFAFNSRKTYNEQLLEYWLKIIPKINWNNRLSDIENKQDTKNFYPIFIIGLPRSGSTLIESIISSGKIKIDNLSETNLVNWSFLNVNKDKIFNSKLDNKEVMIDIDLTSKRLINSFKNLNISSYNQKFFFIEKSLENFFFIELILKIFPNAKFINPNRNYIDNIFAIYTQFLNDIPWSHSIDNILTYMDTYIRVIKDFKKKYPNKILSFSLEEFTDKPEEFSKKIFNFCELEWDSKCLEFYKRDDFFSKTASNNQIRTNIKRYNEKKYLSYKEILNDYSNQYNWLDQN
tara:strand:- start:1179 stop:2669 length:1491 start_codon:yes stop_codon:yes gene_type:complete